MPITPTYPGVYIEEIPSGVKTITGVATSITAFIGRSLRGPADEPVRIQSLADFDRVFGGLWSKSTMSYAVQQCFLNGGTDTIIVRVHKDATTAAMSLPTEAGIDTLNLDAANEGAWANNLQAVVDHLTKDSAEPAPDPKLFNLHIRELVPGTTTGEAVKTESFLNVSTDSDSPRFVTDIVQQESSMVVVSGVVPDSRPTAATTDSNGVGDDGDPIEDDQISDAGLEAPKKGIWALEKADLFNLLCIPPLTRDQDVGTDTTLATAAAYCQKRRAMLIADPPSTWNDITQAEAGIEDLRKDIGASLATNTAVYFPRLKMADAARDNCTAEFAPCGAVAGIMARTDAKRGVWKAPAGIEASLSGVRELSYNMTDPENGRLNPLGLNCVRVFPGCGNVVWGGRTLAGADRLASEWKYLPVRRLTLFIEESLYRGTQWVVFEPNDEPLWAQVRLNVGSFMHRLFRQGAFQGMSPKDAYLVKCDKETTNQDDINRGIVNIVVGFAPLKPAEFVIIKIQQLAGQIPS